MLDDLTVDELASWRHAAKVAQLRLWRALSKWTEGNSLRISVIDPTAPQKPKRETKLAEPAPQDHGRDDFMGRTVRVPSKLPARPGSVPGPPPAGGTCRPDARLVASR